MQPLANKILFKIRNPSGAASSPQANSSGAYRPEAAFQVSDLPIPTSDFQLLIGHRTDKCVGFFYGRIHVLNQRVHFGFDGGQFGLQRGDGPGIEVVL